MAECGNEEKRGLRGAVRCARNGSFLVASIEAKRDSFRQGRNLWSLLRSSE
jgi:hypothetical protein